MSTYPAFGRVLDFGVNPRVDVYLDDVVVYAERIYEQIFWIEYEHVTDLYWEFVITTNPVSLRISVRHTDSQLWDFEAAHITLECHVEIVNRTLVDIF